MSIFNMLFGKNRKRQGTSVQDLSVHRKNSDDDTGMMWGDAGKLYFWIKKDDLKNADFTDVWMILQCG
ncbi:MAG: DUF1963 domain-containing protein [Dehalococcoidales bacterium]|nr:DUF1963 domain-containing protein [Dehalococcoidales bacterium]